MGKLIDLTGQKFGRWAVVERGPYEGRGADAKWSCRCECGTVALVVGKTLRNGTSTQCRRCLGKTKGESQVLHGGHGTPLYVIWKGMRQRCNDRNADSWPWYGAKGIKVCSEWDDFSVFREWARRNGYAPGLSIERKHADEGYNPDNCEWITKSENSRRAMASRWRVKQNGGAQNADG